MYQLTEGQMKQKMEAAAKKVMAQKKALYQNIYPSMEEIGSGWLLPWQIPAPHKKFQSADAYWKATEKKLGFIELLAVAYASSPPEEFEDFLNRMVAELKSQMPAEELPAGFDHKRYALASILMMLRAQFLPNLGRKSEFQAQFFKASDEMFRPVLDAIKNNDDDGAREQNKKIMKRIMALVLKPYQGTPTQQITSEILKEMRHIEQRSMMTYAKCSDWKNLSKPNSDELGIKLGQAEITVTVLDRDTVEDASDDRSPEGVKALKATLNQGLETYKNIMTELLAAKLKKTIEKLEKQIGQTDNENRKKNLQERIEKLKEEGEKQKQSIASFKFDAYPVTAGENCYVIHFSGSSKMVQAPMKLTGLNACLRNGRVITEIKLAGNYPPEQLKKELFHLVDLMDAATMMFRD